MTKFGILKYTFAAFALVGVSLALTQIVIKRKVGTFVAAWLLAIGGGVFFFFYIFNIEPNWIDVHKVVIRDARLAESLEGLKIVQLSDIHLTEGLGRREEDAIQKVNQIEPDFIFITGDFIDDLTQMDPMIDFISRLKAKIGIWGVPGNTDHISIDGKTLAYELERGGIRILVNESERIETGAGRDFWLVGADDPVYKHANLNRALGGVPPGAPTILLAHSPDIFPAAVREEINLVLAGHTHGGQVGIPFLIKMSNYANRTPYMKGLFKKGLTKLYVNRGIGTKTLPIRFLCRPEISVFEVKS